MLALRRIATTRLRLRVGATAGAAGLAVSQFDETARCEYHTVLCRIVL